MDFEKLPSSMTRLFGFLGFTDWRAVPDLAELAQDVVFLQVCRIVEIRISGLHRYDEMIPPFFDDFRWDEAIALSTAGVRRRLLRASRGAGNTGEGKCGGGKADKELGFHYWFGGVGGLMLDLGRWADACAT